MDDDKEDEGIGKEAEEKEGIGKEAEEGKPDIKEGKEDVGEEQKEGDKKGEQEELPEEQVRKLRPGGGEDEEGGKPKGTCPVEKVETKSMLSSPLGPTRFLSFCGLYKTTLSNKKVYVFKRYRRSSHTRCRR